MPITCGAIEHNKLKKTTIMEINIPNGYLGVYFLDNFAGILVS